MGCPGKDGQKFAAIKLWLFSRLEDTVIPSIQVLSLNRQPEAYVSTGSTTEACYVEVELETYCRPMYSDGQLRRRSAQIHKPH